MADTGVPVAGGTTGSLADYAVAADRISSRDYQRIKLQKSTEGSTTATGVDADPLVVKVRQHGTQDYDSGRVAVATGSPASVTTATIYPNRHKSFVSNTNAPGAGAARRLTLTDTADNVRAVLDLAPATTIELPIGGTWVGFKAGADGSGVVLTVAGDQA